MRHVLPTTAWLRTLGCSLLLLGSACADDELPHFGTLQYQSENFEVWASDGLVACGGTYEYTERWLAAFRLRAGEYASNAAHILYWLDDEEFGDDLCRPDAAACNYAESRVIYSTFNPAMHELVHGELGHLRPPVVFREGVAELFGATRLDQDMTALATLWGRDRIPAAAYETTGRFSRYLVDLFGPSAYFELYAALDGAVDRAAVAEGVHALLGADLDTLETDFEATYAACTLDRWRIYDYECGDLPLIDWAPDGTWSESIDLSCGNDKAIGPRDGVIWTLRAFDVETTKTMVLTIDSPDAMLP